MTAALLIAQLPPITPGHQSGVFRVVPGSFTAVSFYERLTPGADLDAHLVVLGILDPEVLRSIGDPSLVPPHQRVYGPGSGWVMPCFTQPPQRRGPTRFSDGTYGVFYAAAAMETSIAEVRYHLIRRLQETAAASGVLAYQVLSADLAYFAVDLRALADPIGRQVHDPDDYRVSQQVGALLRDAESDGVVYRSVRDPGGICYAVFQPSAVHGCHPVQRLAYMWDGARITSAQAGPL